VCGDVVAATSPHTVTLASTNIVLPFGCVIAPKHVGAVLMLILMYIFKLFLRQFDCALVGEKKIVEG
jgi:hypothetical protein